MSYRVETEMQLSLFGSAPAPEVAEAVINAAGVLVGNLMVREYRCGKAYVTITIGRSGNAFHAGRQVAFGDEYNGFCPSKKWNNYCTYDEALDDQISAALGLLSRTVDAENLLGAFDSRRRIEAQGLIDIIQRRQYIESPCP